MIKRHRCTLTTLVLATGLALTGCSAPLKSPQATSEPSVLRIGVTPHRPPMAFRQEGRLRGIEPEIAHRAARELNRPLRLVAADPGDLALALARGELDAVMAPSSLLSDHKGTVLLTQPYLRTGLRLVVRRDERNQLSATSAWKHTGARIGYVYKSAGEEYVRRDLDPYARELYGFPSASAGLRSLKAERIDFLIQSAPAAWWLARGPDGAQFVALGTVLSKEDLVFGVAANNPSLKRVLDQLIDQWRASNVLGRITERWIPVAAESQNPPSSRRGASVRGPNSG